jgi:hypothetical protein
LPRRERVRGLVGRETAPSSPASSTPGATTTSPRCDGADRVRVAPLYHPCPPTTAKGTWRLTAMPGHGPAATLDTSTSRTASDLPKGTWMRQLSQWTARYRRFLRAVVVAVDPGEDSDWAPPPASAPGVPVPDHDLTGFPTRVEDEILGQLDHELRHDLARASLRLTHARRRQRSMNILGHRRAVLESEARVDALHDMNLRHLEIRHARPALPAS